MLNNDTIAAISTPIGEGGLAVVRLSGPRALELTARVFRPAGKKDLLSAPSHTLHYGRIVRNGEVVDEVMVAVLRAPRTFTREEMAEVSCHGGILPAKTILDALLAEGARLAEPGEFTKRAFLNGRIDLAQAEAVADLIQSKTELALVAANEQLAGKLSEKINRLRDQLVQTLAHIEAHIDFPEEDIAPDTREALINRLVEAVGFMDTLLATAQEGRILRRGLRVAIVGRPNVGKSSLLNHLLGHDRAIVSPIPGTTRDTIEETANIRGIPLLFVDTAGLREAGDVIEKEGIRRSREMAARADLILHVLDASEPLDPEDGLYLEEFAKKKRIQVENKTDLPRRLELKPERDAGVQVPSVRVSCVTGEGIEELKDAIRELVWSGAVQGEMVQAMINSRHEEALRRARVAADRAVEVLRAEGGLELAALELRIAMNAVGEIVGKTTTEDLLDSIFSQFCIGK